MKHLYLFLSLTIFCSLTLAQQPERKAGLQYNVQAIGMSVLNTDTLNNMPNEYDMNISNSQLFGFNFEISYRFDETMIVGLGTGYEQINQPKIYYYPFYLTLRSKIGGTGLEAPIFRLDIGTQFGDLAKLGVLFRVGMGYRLPVYKKFCVNIEGVLSYQGIRKEFDEYPGITQSYDMAGVGLAIGFEL